MITDQIKNDFCGKVMEHANRESMTYMDSVIHVSEEYGFGPEMGAKFLSKPLVEKIRIEGEDLNMLPRKSKLPFDI